MERRRSIVFTVEVPTPEMKSKIINLLMTVIVLWIHSVIVISRKSVLLLYGGLIGLNANMVSILRKTHK